MRRQERVKNQLGQLLLIDIPKAVWNLSLERVLQQLQPSGVFFRRLTSETEDVFARTAHALESPPFLAIEDEGDGSLSDLFANSTRLDGLDPNRAERAGELMGRAMDLFGLNLNLAPTVDLQAIIT